MRPLLSGRAGRGAPHYPPVTGSIILLTLVKRLVVLDAGDAQPGHARAVDRALPAREFLEAEAIAFAGLVDAQQSAIDGRDHLRLAPDDPTCGRRVRQRVDGERLAERTDDLSGTDFLVLDHSYLKQNTLSAPRPSGVPTL